MTKPRKQPQDHQKPDPIERVRAEAKRLPEFDELGGLEITVTGRGGEVTVTTLEDPLEWDAECMAHLRAGDYLSAVCGMVSTKDDQLLRAVRPSLGSILEALMQPSPEGEIPGESQAS